MQESMWFETEETTALKTLDTSRSLDLFSRSDEKHCCSRRISRAKVAALVVVTLFLGVGIATLCRTAHTKNMQPSGMPRRLAAEKNEKRSSGTDSGVCSFVEALSTAEAEEFSHAPPAWPPPTATGEPQHNKSRKRTSDSRLYENVDRVEEKRAKVSLVQWPGFPEHGDPDTSTGPQRNRHSSSFPTYDHEVNTLDSRPLCELEADCEEANEPTDDDIIEALSGEDALLLFDFNSDTSYMDRPADFASSIQQFLANDVYKGMPSIDSTVGRVGAASHDASLELSGNLLTNTLTTATVPNEETSNPQMTVATVDTVTLGVSATFAVVSDSSADEQLRRESEGVHGLTVSIGAQDRRPQISYPKSESQSSPEFGDTFDSTDEKFATALRMQNTAMVPNWLLEETAESPESVCHRDAGVQHHAAQYNVEEVPLQVAYESSKGVSRDKDAFYLQPPAVSTDPRALEAVGREEVLSTSRDPTAPPAYSLNEQYYILHPFHRIPDVEQTDHSFIWMDAGADISLRRSGVIFENVMEEARQLLAKERLTVAEIGKAIHVGRALTVYATMSLSNALDSTRVDKLSSSAGRRFILLDTLWCMLKVAGPKINKEEVWRRLPLGLFQMNVRQRRPRSNTEPRLPTPREQLISRLQTALQVYATGERLAAREVVKLKTMLICGPSPARLFRGRMWEAWRIDNNNYSQIHGGVPWEP